MRIAIAAAAAAVVVALPASAGARTDGSPLENIVTSCPTAAETSAIDARLKLTFEADPTAGTAVCGTTRLRANAYRTLLALQQLQYAKPLPWTSNTIWDWLTHAITSIRFRDDIPYSFCCEPANTINIRTQTVVSLPWDDPVVGGDFLAAEATLLVHEARHNEGMPHTCGNLDRTLAEQGAWAAQAELEIWNALYSGNILDSASTRSVHRSTELRSAFYVFQSDFCDEPRADLSATVTASAATVVAGGSLTLTVKAANAGPDTARQTYLATDVPEGTELVAAAPSQGKCTSAAVPKQVSCELGAIAAGATASVTLDLRLTATTGAIGYDAPSPQGSPPLGATVLAAAVDPSFDNNQVTSALHVAVSAPPSPPTTPQPNPKPKPLPKCKRGQHSTKPHPCRK